MTELGRGLYDVLLTHLLDRKLESLPETHRFDTGGLRNAEAADRLALHLATVVERAIEMLPEEERASAGASLVGHLIERLATETHAADLREERPTHPTRVLKLISKVQPDGSAESIAPPLIPLLDTTLLTNAPGEPRVGHQILTEIASADRIDVVMAFIRRSGIAPLRDALRRHIEAGRPIRVLTTTYTGSTEGAALDLLRDLGADVRVSYDVSTTRLHAKAWLFHRDSGYSTAYVGSSNLTHAAQVAGLEWNVRVSAARNRAVIDKIAAVFESYWRQPEFEPYDAGRFAEATRSPDSRSNALFLSPVEIRLEPFQERLLEQIALSRRQGHHRNLLVSATGTGKTVMAAVDYARLASELPRARLLFVAHREEILAQSRATFAHALRDAAFGELWVGGERPRAFEHVFASIQSLNAAGLDALAPDHFDVVIIDEFHHAAATSYTRLLQHVAPRELLGLTATPERADSVSVLDWFGGRIAAELRLWDAIDQHRLTPFAYYGIADELDMRDVPWRRGTGYDVDGLTNLITASDFWARSVLHQLEKTVGRLDDTRALGFCVSIQHAQYMARVFNAHGVRAVAVWGESSDEQRRAALTDLAAKRVNVVFSVDLFNEGVDVPSVDTILMLRPTDSPVLFLQQLGRGLRRSADKSVCTVLDFVAQHRREFRYDRRFRALLGGSRQSVSRQVAEGFPFLPAGCHMELDRVATERVLQSIKYAVPTRWAQKVEELRLLAAEDPSLSLEGFLDASGLELDDVYDGKRGWSDLLAAAGLATHPAGPREDALRKACGRLVHVDDSERIDTWRDWLSAGTPPRVESLGLREQRLLRMLLIQLLDRVVSADVTLAEGAQLLWAHPQVRSELVALLNVLARRITHLGIPLAIRPLVPMTIHGQYTRLEIQAAVATGDRVRVRPWREGVLYDQGNDADIFVFTLDKTHGQFSPTTRYRDYAISRELIHWESQSGTREDSPTGRRYRDHARTGGAVLMFGRISVDERAFTFLGPATYVSHVGEAPMAVTWQLQHPLPGDLFQGFAAAVA